MLQELKTAIPLPIAQLESFCDRWQIVELSLFGSILRDDFHPNGRGWHDVGTLASDIWLAICLNFLRYCC